MMTKEDRELIKQEAKALADVDISSLDDAISFTQNIIKVHPFTYFNILKGKRFSKIWIDILKKTKFLNEYFSPNSATRIYYYVNRLNDIVVCETCGKYFKKNISASSPLKHFFCCNKCAQLHESTIAKTKNTKLIKHGDPNWNNMEKNRMTCIDRYGVEYSWQAKEVKDKCKKSIQEHFGVDHQMQSKEVKDGMRQRYREKYGVDYPFQDPEVQAKINATIQKNYGVDWPMQSKELHEIMHQNSVITKKRNYFDEVISNFKTVTSLFTSDEYIEKSKEKLPLKWKCNLCGEEFEQFLFQYGLEPRCLKCNPLIYNRVDSNEEIDLFNFMSNIEGSKYDCLRHSYWNWNLLGNGKLLDIICVDKNTEKPCIAIEFNGLYWHQTSKKELGYHLMKTKLCEDAGVKLIHIWEDEWVNNNAAMKTFLSLVMRDEFYINENMQTMELDRSHICKLWVPDCYSIEENFPNVVERIVVDNNRSINKLFLVEDCGTLTLKKINV